MLLNYIVDVVKLHCPVLVSIYPVLHVVHPFKQSYILYISYPYIYGYPFFHKYIVVFVGLPGIQS